MPVDKELKRNLLKLCLAYAEEKVKICEEAIKQTQGSANEETKSSSGDKYETGRAMAQLEIEKHTLQLHDAKNLKQCVMQINSDYRSESVQVGSIVITNAETYFIAIPAGKMTIDNESFYAVSPASPIGKALMGLKKNSSFQFNKKKLEIIDLL